ncbi:MAG: methylase [Thermoprotei archaeon]|nr:MAG: methylase [Thermoprotei archaeon]
MENVLKPKVRRIVVLPSTLFLKDKEPIKTYKIGQLARMLAIFRVEEIIIYCLDREYKNGKYLKSILEYIETPQYLRKLLYPKMKILKNVGVLPPLRTPHHSKIQEAKRIKFREGVVLEKIDENRHLVYIGERNPIFAVGKVEKSRRVTVKLINSRYGKIVDRQEVPYYWGYTVSLAKDIYSILKGDRRCLKIGTSRKGCDIRTKYRELIQNFNNGRYTSVALYFGAYDRGLDELLGNVDVNEFFDYYINFAPNQGTKTIRTEEAVGITLSILNLLMD